MTTCDIKHAIGGIINEYIKPKAPIYEVSYIVSICYLGDLETITKNHLVELSKKPSNLFTNNRPTISAEVVKTWNNIIKNGFTPSIRLDDVKTDIFPYEDDADIIINIISLNRVA